MVSWGKVQGLGVQTRKLNGPTPQGQIDKPGLSTTLENKHSDLKVAPTTALLSVKIVAKLYISTFDELEEKTMCFVLFFFWCVVFKL